MGDLLYRWWVDDVIRDIYALHRTQKWGVVNFLYFANAMQYRLYEKPHNTRDEVYLGALERGDFLLPDGIALQMRDWWTYTPRSRLENLNGTDLTPQILAHYAAAWSFQVFVLYLYDPRIEKWPERLEKSLEKLRVTYGCEAYGYQVEYPDRDQIEPKRLRLDVPLIPWTPRILLNCLGTPAQEIWTQRYRDRVRANEMLVLNVGGFIDFFVWFEQRAPQWVVKMRVGETFYRIITNPKKNLRKFLAMFGVFRVIRKKIQSKIIALVSKKKI
jgi:exopolysaccharide biosynthesis WecB/TagA/CpsF family protein